MMTIDIHHDSTIPLELHRITPDQLEALSARDVSKQPVLFGNRFVELGEVAKVTDSASDGDLCFTGQTDRVKQIGAGMTQKRME